VIQDLTYTYFPDAMVQSIASARPGDTWSWTYTYDDLNRLLTATNSNPALSQSFTYNDIGNMMSNSAIGSYSYPSSGTPKPHAVSSAGTRGYCYNAIGQMTSRNGTPGTCSSGTQIQWNGDGKPSSVGSTVFVYDGVGVRLKKTTGSTTTRYLGGDYEIAPNGTITKYLQGGKKVAAQYFIHHRDHLGSIESVTDASGVEVRGQKHKPFGDQFGVTGTQQESKGWIGEREEETELVYLNARYYDPEIGRFTAPDPVIGAGQNLNRYSYSVNSPTNFSDPSGLSGNCVWVPVGGDVKIADNQIGFIYFCPQPPPPPQPPSGGGPGSNVITQDYSPTNPRDRRERQGRPHTGCGHLGSGPCPDEGSSTNSNTGGGGGGDDGGAGGGGDDDGGGGGNDNNNTTTDPIKYAPDERPVEAVVLQRVSAFLDGVVPFADPYEPLYNEDICPECWLSEDIGSVTASVELFVASWPSRALYGAGTYFNTGQYFRFGHTFNRGYTYFGVRGKLVPGKHGIDIVRLWRGR
jgi:RHS repeat-associated protein